MTSAGMGGGDGKNILTVRNAKDFASAFNTNASNTNVCNTKVFNVSRETCQRLEIYADCLCEWNRAINLVSPKTIEHIWQRHFADSAQLLAYATDSLNWLDLGSGAGFPGLVIAILTEGQKGRSVQLVESNGKKCAFLRHVAAKTGVTVEIIEARIETLHDKPTLRPVDIVTARALSPLAKLLDQAAPFFANNTRALFLKGRDAETELQTARESWSFQFRQHPSRTDAQGQIIEIWNLVPTGKP